MENNNNTSDNDLDIQRIIDISGMDLDKKPKAHVVLRHVDTYSDGTTREIASAVIIKPIVYVFKHAGYVNVRLDFGDPRDHDLSYFWQILDRYSQPENSVSYLPEEIESGIYIDSNKRKRLVYFPTIHLTLSPIGKETDYQMVGFNPIFYTLQPQAPNGKPTVLQFTFPEEWFLIVDKLDPIDMEEMYKEVFQLMSDENIYISDTKNEG